MCEPRGHELNAKMCSGADISTERWRRQSMDTPGIEEA